jgi:deoxyribonuclease V
MKLLKWNVTSLAPIAVVDVAYTADAAGVACVLADSWLTAAAQTEISRCFACAPAAYVPGEFYKRELPLLRAVIDDLRPLPAVIVIDGYVWLGADGAPGLGAHLFEALQSAIPIIGVAKTQYRGDTWSERICRGKSRKLLYVTAAGVDGATAARLISGMHGEHRIPTLLQRADRVARAALPLMDATLRAG